MANPEHLAILKEGVEVWNQWREENPEIQPDLSNSDLCGENLDWVNFSGVNLFGADLSETSLMGADVVAAYLVNANLFKSKLLSINFAESELIDANLSRAKIHGIDFRHTGLDRANFDKARIALSVFADIDFQTLKGLETVIHEGPSTIGIDTLYRSKGNIPESFLRGCGVPDQMIEYARSLTTTPIQYYSCFISYSHKDEELAQRIHNDLQASGVRCWFAPHDLKIGDKIRPVIDESIRVHDKLLLILSEHSVQSEWVEHEVEHAFDREWIEKKNILFPVRLDESVMDSTTGWAGNIRRQRHIGDFSRWKDHDSYKRAFDRLLRDLKSEK
jgi:hypothetical protein